MYVVHYTLVCGYMYTGCLENYVDASVCVFSSVWRRYAVYSLYMRCRADLYMGACVFRLYLLDDVSICYVNRCVNLFVYRFVSRSHSLSRLFQLDPVAGNNQPITVEHFLFVVADILSLSAVSFSSMSSSRVPPRSLITSSYLPFFTLIPSCRSYLVCPPITSLV